MRPTADVQVRRGRWAVAAMFTVNGFLVGSWAVQIPFLLQRHPITESTLGLLILLFGAGAVAAMSTTGRLLNRFGSRTVALSFGMVACLALSAVVLAPSLLLVCPALLLFGAGAGSMDVAMNANAVEVERRLGHAVMSSSHGFWSIGGFSGGVLAVPLLGWFGSSAHVMIASGLALAVLLAAQPFVISEARHPATGRPAYVRPKGWAIVVLGLMALASMVPEGAVIDWAAIYLASEHGAGLAQSSLGFALFAGAMAAMRFAGDAVRNRYGAVRVMRISAWLAAAGMLIGGLAPVGWLVIAGFMVAGLGIANMVPILFSASGNQPGLPAASGIALVTTMGYSGLLAAPSIIGFAGEYFGFRGVFVVLAFCLALVALNAFRVGVADRVRVPTGAALPARSTG